MKKSIILSILTAISLVATAQGPNILFIGNSYTEVNNLPQMVYNIAQSMGEDMTYASNTPGGCTFYQHCTNHSMEMICQGGWDVVVLQEQSQYPSFPQSQVENEVFPYAERLIDSIYAHNPCAEPMLYMTWGRKNGDQSNAQFFPVLGTYEGMDSMLYERYVYMAETYDASVCPVGRVWRYLRTNHPDIELYQSDGSHPSTAGTYAAACAFYTMIFQRDPDSINYTAGLDATTARIIRTAAHNVVFETISRWQRTMPLAAIHIDTLIGTRIELTLACENSHNTTCDFGDGTDSTFTITANQTLHHTYADTGHYTIRIIAERHCMTDTASIEVWVSDTNTGTGIRTQAPQTTSIYPNPTQGDITLHSNTASTATITDESGRTIGTFAVNPGTTVLPTRSLPDGIYIIKIDTPMGNESHIFLKQ